jgi:hypothetical protein
MRSLILMLACTVMPALGQHNRLTPAEQASGWRLLFDGHTMNGWRDPLHRTPPGDAWKIEGDCLAAQPNPALVEDLVSQETFRDFELVFDWRISPGGNSGVKYRIQELVMMRDQPQGTPAKFEDLVELSIRNRRPDRPAKGQEYVVGFEYQIIDNKASSDARYGPIRATASLYELAPVARDVTRPVGEFNHSRLVVKGRHTEHWLNGEKVLDTLLDAPPILEGLASRWGRNSPVYSMLAKIPRLDCPISLQNHTFPAWFRNIKIRRLD